MKAESPKSQLKRAFKRLFRAMNFISDRNLARKRAPGRTNQVLLRSLPATRRRVGVHGFAVPSLGRLSQGARWQTRLPHLWEDSRLRRAMAVVAGQRNEGDWPQDYPDLAP